MPDATSPAPSLGGHGHLGNRQVARIGYGVMQLGHHPRPEAESVAMLRAARQAGVDHFDTAQFYGDTNARIADALGDRRDELTIVSKVGAARSGAGLVPAQKPAELRAQIEENLSALRTDRLDVVNLRRLDGPPGIIAEGDQIVDLDAQLAELIALRADGKIGAIGLSVVSADQLQAALGAGIVCVQNLYSLVDRDAQPVLDLCRRHGIAWVPFFPLGSAFPGRRKVVDEPEVIATAAELAVTPAQVGLAWLLARYENTLLIPGTTSPVHLAENVAAGDVVLSEPQLARLDGVSAT